MSNYIAHGGKILVLGVFLYFGIDSILSPHNYAGLIPEFLTTYIDPIILVSLHGIVEVLCALLLLIGFGGRWPWYVLLVSFLGVLVSVSGNTLIRDVGILGGLLLIRPPQKKD